MDPVLAELKDELEQLTTRVAGREAGSIGSGEWKIIRARIWSLEKRIAELEAKPERPGEL